MSNHRTHCLLYHRCSKNHGSVFKYLALGKHCPGHCGRSADSTSSWSSRDVICSSLHMAGPLGDPHPNTDAAPQSGTAQVTGPVCPEPSGGDSGLLLQTSLSWSEPRLLSVYLGGFTCLLIYNRQEPLFRVFLRSPIYRTSNKGVGASEAPYRIPGGFVELALKTNPSGQPRTLQVRKLRLREEHWPRSLGPDPGSLLARWAQSSWRGCGCSHGEAGGGND